LQWVNRLERDGWTAGWCYRNREFIAQWEPIKRTVSFPNEALALLDRIDAKTHGKGTCWGVFAWKDGRPQFFDLIRRGSGQKRSDGQNIWRDAAVAAGVPKDSFREINWLGGSFDGYSLKAMSVVQGRVDGWVRYRRGEPFEYGGESPDRAARDWVEGYKRGTGLDGPDLLWVLFRDQAGGNFSYWNIEQRRDR
jgi:hypothetical protein